MSDKVFLSKAEVRRFVLTSNDRLTTDRSAAFIAATLKRKGAGDVDPKAIEELKGDFGKLVEFLAGLERTAGRVE